MNTETIYNGKPKREKSVILQKIPYEHALPKPS